MTSGSTQGARAHLVELLAENAGKDVQLEKTIRELAGGAQSHKDVRVVLGMLTTGALRKAFEEMQKQQRASEEYQIIGENL